MINDTRHAQVCLDRRLGCTLEREQLAAAKDRPDCEIRLDRTQMTASSVSEKLILGIPGFRRTSKHFLKRKHAQDFLPYQRITTFTSNTSIFHLTVLSDRRMPHIAPCKVTLIGRDETGLQAEDVIRVLEFLPDSKLVLVELAFDFGFGSGVDGALFDVTGYLGNADEIKLDRFAVTTPGGQGRGRNLSVVTLSKRKLGVHRVELQLNRRFLIRHGLKDIFNFRRLSTLLPQRHIFFSKLEEDILGKQLKRAGHKRIQVRRLMERVHDSDGDLLAQIALLRKKGKLKNVRRSLVPLRMNDVISEALKKWAAKWPVTPRRIR